jgi:serine-type D-Ala-D-Ala carboxypeptidase
MFSSGTLQFAKGAEERALAGHARGTTSLIDDEIAALLKRGVVWTGAAPGASAAVGAFTAGRWRFALGSAGVLSPLRARPVNAHTLYDLASITKPVVACVAARLVQGGSLRWDAPLAHLLALAAGTPSASAPLAWLASHRAGLHAHLTLYERYYGGTQARAAHTQPFLMEAARARRAECVGTPGPDGFPPLYSDLGYILLGAALEALTGRALDALVREHVCAPLQLQLGSARQWEQRLSRPGFVARVAPTESSPVRGGEILGAVHDDNAWVLAGTASAGHAGLFGDALDVAGFGAGVVDALRARTPSWLSPSAAQALVAPRGGGTLRMGFDGKALLGSSAGERFGPNTFGHLGFTGTSLWCDPDAQIVVALLTNRVCPSRQNITLRALRPALHGALFDRGMRLR